MIAHDIGRKLAVPAEGRMLRMTHLEAASDVEGMQERMRHQRAWVVDEYTGVACTFLVNDRCSIYEHRPLACRLHISMSEDALRCRLVPGRTIRAPYIDARPEQALHAKVFGTNVDTLTLADIRDWFPAQGPT